jgi:hypothetical protein
VCKAWSDVFFKGKAVPLQAWSGPEVSRKLMFPYFLTTAQYGGKVVSPTYRTNLPPGNSPGTHFCQKLSRPQGHLGSNQRPSDLQRSTLTTVLPRFPDFFFSIRNSYSRLR